MLTGDGSRPARLGLRAVSTTLTRPARVRASLFAIVVALALLAAPGPRALAAGRCGAHPWCDTTLGADARAGLLLGALTQDEKVSLLAGDDITGGSEGAPGSSGHTGISDGVPRVGLPNVYFTDGPNGVRQGAATAMPAPIGLAATFDAAMAGAYGGLVGNEARAKGNDVLFGPTVNIMRNPLGGRTFEGFGEDPLLAARTAVAYIDALQAQGVIADVKHFAANNQEGVDGGATAFPGSPVGAGVNGSRYVVNANVDERTLREIYFPAFEAAITEAHSGTIMCAYNRVNTQYACENKHLLEDVLRHDWGFTGFVLADYGAAHNAVASLNNGLDFDPWPAIAYSPAAVDAALLSGAATPAQLDAHVRAILRTLFAFGFFDRPAFANDDAQIDRAAHARVAGQVEDRAITLLRNRGVLPLDAGRLHSLAVIGADAAGYTHGGGSSDVTPFSVSQPLPAITKRAGAGVAVHYDDGTDATRAAALAKGSDAAIVFASDYQTEGADKSCLTLECGNSQRGNQDGLIDAVAAANPRTVVVLETGGPVLTPWRDRVGGLLEAWYPGADGGNSIARVLFGDVNPAGRLPATFPNAETDTPTSGDPQKYPGVAFDETYKEGLQVGYRWYDARGIAPAFPFGYGLSYTTFAYRHLRVGAPAPNGDVKVRFDLANTGPRSGDEVAQVYLGAPAAPQPYEPPRRLAGFARVTIPAGGLRHVTISIPHRERQYYDVATSAWRDLPGCLPLIVASSSRDARLTASTCATGAALCRPALVFRIHQPRHARIVRVVGYIDGRVVRVVRGRRVTRVVLPTPPRLRFSVRIVDYASNGLRITTRRRYAGCSSTRPQTTVSR